MTACNNNPYLRPSIYKVDNGGNLLWKVAYDDGRIELKGAFYDVIETSNNHFVAVGGKINYDHLTSPYSQEYSLSIYVVEIDGKDGSIIGSPHYFRLINTRDVGWHDVSGNLLPQPTGVAYSISLTYSPTTGLPEGYVLTGEYGSGPIDASSTIGGTVDNDIFLLKLDNSFNKVYLKSGDPVEHKSFDGPVHGNDRGYCVKPSFTGGTFPNGTHTGVQDGYLICGHILNTNSAIPPVTSNDIWIAKTDIFGETPASNPYYWIKTIDADDLASSVNRQHKVD